MKPYSQSSQGFLKNLNSHSVQPKSCSDTNCLGVSHKFRQRVHGVMRGVAQTLAELRKRTGSDGNVNAGTDATGKKLKCRA